MSSFYDDASLVVIPSGYKTSKVYAEKPTDGSGDLAFTRTGDTATRVNSAGLIEKVRTNLILQSQTFDNASWTKGNLSVSANTIANPLNGATTADTIVEAATTGAHYLYQSPSLTGVFTYSVYAKAKERDHIVIAGSINATNFYSALFDLTSGTVQQTANGSSTTLTASIVSAGNGWYRCSVALSSAVAIPFVIWTSDGSTLNPTYYEPSYAGDGTSGVYVFGAQAETGDIATDYIPTTTAAVSVGPVANVPRLDYLGSTCPRLLLEPQRTNLYTFSEQLNKWTASSATVTANYAVSPDGYTNADRVQFSAGGLLYISGTGSAGENTLSVYAKATNGTSAKFRFFGNGNTTFSSDQTATGEWQRFTFTFTYSTATAGLKIATTGADDILFWGFQHEIGSYATSYIPTLAASATRGADACSKTGISSLIGQTEGVAFIDFVWNGLTGVGNYPRIIELATDANNIIQLYSIAGTTSWGWDIINGGVVQFSGSSTMALGRNKIAIGYKLNDMVVYQNGTLLASDTSCTVPATSALGVTGIFNGAGGAQLAASVNQTLLFKTRLTNAELAELTTI